MTDRENTFDTEGEKVEKTLPEAPDQYQRARSMLVDFGLSESETAVYITLLGAGRELGGSDIAKRAGIPRQYVYQALPSLRRLGLIIEIAHGKQSRYKAVAENEIEKIAKHRLVQAEKLVQELATFSKVGFEQDFEVIQGDEAIRQFELENVARMTAGEYEYIIGGASDGFAKTMGGTINRYLNEKKKKNIGVKYIGSEDEEPYYKKFIGIYPNQEYRFMKRLPKGVAHMVVRKDSVSFYSFLNPSLIYIIKSDIVAKNYGQFFLMLWEMAGEEK